MHVPLSIIVAGLTTTALIAASSPVAGFHPMTAEAERPSTVESGTGAELPSAPNIAVYTHTDRGNESTMAIFHFDKKLPVDHRQQA
ncbi:MULTISPECIES: hypothetical protein [Catenuloplanes]|uniref:Uncharacterized protein n=1 Tax=Catenuloplanes niger TaxID=587534 RepID=A0AAE4CQR6_9ACTN|nr:hypothetical protein [Catenuloplanes niger]MDR7321250.1 hypothetical protein [Catenuloplanes niger]